MIAYAAPSSHVRLKRLYGTPIVSGRCGGTEIELSWRSYAKQILSSIAERQCSEHETGGIRSRSRART